MYPILCQISYQAYARVTHVDNSGQINEMVTLNPEKHFLKIFIVKTVFKKRLKMSHTRSYGSSNAPFFKDSKSVRSPI